MIEKKFVYREKGGGVRRDEREREREKRVRILERKETR